MTLFPPVMFASGLPARDAWPLDPATVHLNHGSFGAVPTEVVRVQDAERTAADWNPIGWFPAVARRIGEARVPLAAFVGARPEDTAIIANASGAATVVYNSLRLSPGDEILVTDHGYGAITLGARRLARRTGAVLREVPIDLDASADAVVAAFADALTERVRLIVVDQITSATARHFPTDRITALAHSRGARVLVDGAHAPGLIADAAAVGGGDWWFGNMHKWPATPRGCALLVTRASDRDELWPLIDSWGADLPFPERFDYQATLDASGFLAAPAALSLIEREYGWERARQTLDVNATASATAIAEALQPHVSGDALPDVGMPVSSMRLVRLPDGLGTTQDDANALRERMFAEHGIETAFTSFRGVGYYRVSVHLYTTSADIERFIDQAVPALVSWAR